MRVAILGNSGSGKSTLAKWLATRYGAPALDLDTVAWEPGTVGVPRTPEAAQEDVERFCRSANDWFIEGCYAHLVETALASGAHLVFLNPGVAQCLANCRARPWEEHKYASREEQDRHLAFLFAWVGEYYTRQGDVSLAGHRALFDAYQGPKLELTEQSDLRQPAPRLLDWFTHHPPKER
jgi:adenylate kinase family enzyme